MGETAKYDGCTAIRETGKALHVTIPELYGGDPINAVWVPKSQIHDDSEVYDAEEHANGMLVVSEWFATQKGWL